ncbi:MAG TPA: tetratricopeptide repeat protein, partial [bacterium]|nr:tetratricopeptide repeat protein [bacterium]
TSRLLANRTRSDDLLAHALQLLITVERGVPAGESHRRFDDVLGLAPKALLAATAPSVPRSPRLREGVLLAGAVRGYDLIRRQEYAQAQQVLGRFLKGAPEDPQLLLLMGEAHRLQGRQEQAMGYQMEYRAALESAGLWPEPAGPGANPWTLSQLDETHPLQITNHAVNRYLYRDFEGATERTERAIAISPRAYAVAARALLKIEAGDLEGAARDLADVQGVVPYSASVTIHRARIPFMQGDYAAAARLLEEGRSRTPADARLALELGYVRASLGDAAGSAEALNEARGLGAPPGRLALVQGHAALILHRLSAAEGHYSEALKLGEPTALLGRAHALFNRGQYAEAAADFELYAETNPDHAHALLWSYLTRRLQEPPHLVHLYQARQRLRSFERARPQEPWPAGLMRLHLDGERGAFDGLTEDPLGTLGPAPDARHTAAWRCVLAFHRSWIARWKGDLKTAEAQRQRCLG